MFVFKTSYGGDNRAQQILEALKAAVQRGVEVYVVLNYSQYEPDVAFIRRLLWVLGVYLLVAPVKLDDVESLKYQNYRRRLTH